MQLSWQGIFQDIFFIEFFKYLTKSQHPDHVFGDIEEETASKLINEHIDEKSQTIIIRVGFSPEEKVPFQAEPNQQSRDTIKGKCFGNCIGDSNFICIENSVIEFIPNLTSQQFQLPEPHSEINAFFLGYTQGKPEGIKSPSFKRCICPCKNIFDS